MVMASNRSVGRDIYIYDAHNPNIVLGGLILTNGVTNANFYSMVEVFLRFDSDYLLLYEAGTVIKRDEQVLRRENYYIVTNSKLVV